MDARKSRLLEKADAYFAAGDYERAEIEYKNVLQLEALNPEAITRMGMIYLEQGRLGRASAYLGKANELTPENIDLRLKLGYLYLGMNRLRDAGDCAAFVLERQPQNPDAPILLAEAAATPSEAAAARTRLQQLPPPAPGTAPVLTALGLIDLRERKNDAAFTLLQRAHEADPKNIAATVTLGRVYWARNDLVQAERLMKDAAEKAPLRSPIRLQHVQFHLQTGRVDVAKTLLAELNAKVPDFLPIYVLLANIAATEKRYDDSLSLLDKLLLQEPMHPEGLLLTAQVRMAKGENDKALAILEKAAVNYSQSPQLHYQLGLVHIARGDLAAAGASLNESVKLAPGFAAATLALAQVNIRQRNLVPAIAALKTFLQQNPTHAQAQLLLAEAYRSQGNPEEALAIYQQLAEANPRDAQAQLLIGTTLLQQNKPSEARAAFARAVAISPAFLPALEQLVNLDLAAKQYEQAKVRIESFIAKQSNNAVAHLILAKVHILQGDAEKAESALRRTIELKPDSAVPYTLLAQQYIKTNQTEKALPAMQSAVAQNPKDPNTWMLLGTLQEQKKDFAAARDSYEKVIALDPNAAVALNNLAYIYSEQFGDLDKAQQAAQKARDLLPNQGETADTLGWVLHKKGQYARALTLLEESAEKLRDNAEVHFHLGMTHYMMGNEEVARSALEKALKLDPAFGRAGDIRKSLRVLAIDGTKAGKAERTELGEVLAKHKDDSVALIRLAAIHERSGDADKALSSFESVLKANPSNVPAALGAIRLYQARNEKAKALELAKATRKLVPGNGSVAHVLGRLAFESGDRLWSVGVLQEAARSQAGNPEVLFDLAEALYSVGQVASAEAALKEALAANPRFSRANQAREYLELLDLVQTASSPSASAIGTMNRVLASDNSHVPGLMARAAMAENKAEFKAAAADYEKALVRLPDFAPAKRQLTLIYASAPGNDAKALEIAAKAREAYPSDPEVAKAFGIILFRQGNHARAASLLQESARTRTEDAELMYYLGMAQRHLKNDAAGARSLERALELGLSGTLASEARRHLATGQ